MSIVALPEHLQFKISHCLPHSEIVQLTSSCTDFSTLLRDQRALALEVLREQVEQRALRVLENQFADTFRARLVYP